jgi:hypothetical protein
MDVRVQIPAARAGAGHQVANRAGLSLPGCVHHIHPHRFQRHDSEWLNHLNQRC